MGEEKLSNYLLDVKSIVKSCHFLYTFVGAAIHLGSHSVFVYCQISLAPLLFLLLASRNANVTWPNLTAGVSDPMPTEPYLNLLE